MGVPQSTSSDSSHTTQSSNTKGNNQYDYYSNNKNQTDTNSSSIQKKYKSFKQIHFCGYGTAIAGGINYL